MTPPDKYGKRRQITFRIGPIAEDRLRQVAALFNLKPTEYAKAMLYKDLGVFNEPLDQRRRTWRKKKKPEFDEEKAFRGETDESGLPGITAEDLKRGKKHRATDMETDAETDVDSEFEEDEFYSGRGSTKEEVRTWKEL